MVVVRHFPFVALRNFLVDNLVRKNVVLLLLLLLLLKLQVVVIVVVEAVINSRLVDGLLNNWLLTGCDVVLVRVQIWTEREVIILFGRRHVHFLPSRAYVHVSKLLLNGVHIFDFLVILSCFQFGCLFLKELAKEVAVKVSGGSFLVDSIRRLHDAVWVVMDVLHWSLHHLSLFLGNSALCELLIRLFYVITVLRFLLIHF
jgi:hypothetical protein